MVYWCIHVSINVLWDTYAISFISCLKSTDYSLRSTNTVKPVLRGHLWDKEKVAI